MDWSKVDAALAGALADAHAGERGGAERLLPVFVHVDVDQADQTVLAELDVGAAASGICTGNVSIAGVARLTDQPWVTQVRLSGPLRLR